VQLIGQVLQETYRIERLLGRGGKGEVYLASHLRLPRRFAVKVLFPHNAYKKEEVLRFRREAEVVSALGHPHIIEVIDFNHTPWGAPYIVMEYLEGEDLSARLQRVTTLPLAEMGVMLKQVCSALQAAHAKGIIHRDLKPSNIFLCRKADQEDYIKVVDFGLSKVWGASVAVTDGRLAIGTPRYMAPEQAIGRSSEADARTDVFSLGAIMFRMLTGELPFIGESIQALLNAIVFLDPPLVTEVVANVPESVARVVDQALRKRPEDRFQSMEELWSAFEEASGLGFSSIASQSVTALALSGPGAQWAPEAETCETIDPHPEHSATFTHALGEVIEPAPIATTEATAPHAVRRRQARKATGLFVVATAFAVAGVGIWLGLRLIRTDPVIGGRGGQDGSVLLVEGGPATTPLDAERGPVDAAVVVWRRRPDAGKPAKPSPLPRRRQRGVLQILTRSGGQMAWAHVYVDGRKVGQSHAVQLRLVVGTHVVVVHRPGFPSRTLRVRVKANKTVKVTVDLER